MRISFCCVVSLLLTASASADELPKPTGEAIVSPDAKLELLFTRSAPINGGLTEGPAVAPDGSIYFTDIPLGTDKGMILRFDPKTKKTTVFTDASGKANGLMFDAQGRLLACEGSDYGGQRVSRWDVKTGRCTTVVDRFQGKRFNAPNDLCLDRAGRIYFTDPRYLGPEPRELEHRAVYRINLNSTVVEVTHDVAKPNGIIISPDRKTLYVADHDNGTDRIDPTQPPPKPGPMTIYAFPLGRDGLVNGPRRTLVDFGAGPGCDGMTVDEHGHIYLTVRDLKRPGVMVINPQGKEVAFIPTGPPEQRGGDPDHPPVGIPSNVVFGLGDERNVLYVTIDLSLYRIPLKVNGYHVQFPAGTKKKVSWNGSKIQGSPDPPTPFRTAVAFEHLKFDEPAILTEVTGTDRMAVVQRNGKIFTFRADPDTDRADLLLDMDRNVVGGGGIGLAFHPAFTTNGYFYLTYVIDPVAELPNGTRLSRFQVLPDKPFRADPSTEKILIEWPSGGHNGGCIQFGPDGYLYLAAGDGSGFGDEFDTGQDISDLLASLLRIDVDHPDPGMAYGIPKDNPFVGRAGARPEIWAYGLRQLWQFNFDRATGDLWGGEVGQDLWEMVYRIRRGGNYGWSVNEGSHPFRPDRKTGPSPILPPIVEHSHAVFRSVTGGFVYHGKRLKELAGAYIYGDYDTGQVWSLRYDGQKVTEHKQLVDTALRIVCFGQDHVGEVYMLDHVTGRIHELVRSPASATVSRFPRKLSETGLFTSVVDMTPAPGVIPYDVNAALWSDGASKERFLAIPGDGQIEFDAIEYPQPSPGVPHGWRFPHGTVLVKTFMLETERGNPDSLRRLETRILHHERLTGYEIFGDQYWRGYTYIWNDEQTDAMLLEGTDSLERTYTMTDADAPGGTRKQTWHFPSRAECTLCHTMPAKFVLGVNTMQMNRDHDYGDKVANQLTALEQLGMFTEPLPAPPERLPKMARYADPTETRDARARAYLDANCSHCHRKWGGGNADFHLLSNVPLAETSAINRKPIHGSFGIEDARILAPGDPDRSVILHRMAKLGPGRMPHVGSGVVDTDAVKLIRDWIANLPADGS